jgi:hypothetical protein
LIIRLQDANLSELTALDDLDLGRGLAGGGGAVALDGLDHLHTLNDLSENLKEMEERRGSNSNTTESC